MLITNLMSATVSLSFLSMESIENRHPDEVTEGTQLLVDTVKEVSRASFAGAT